MTDIQMPNFMKRTRKDRMPQEVRVIPINEEELMRAMVGGVPAEIRAEIPAEIAAYAPKPRTVEHAGPFADHVSAITKKIMDEAEAVSKALENRAQDIRNHAKEHVEGILAQAIEAATAIQECTLLAESAKELHTNLIGKVRAIAADKQDQETAAANAREIGQ